MIAKNAMGQIVTQVTPQLARIIVENVKNKVDNIDLGEQSADSSVGYQYSVSDEEARIEITVESGNIQGTQIIDVPEHKRWLGSRVGTGDVRAHERKYEDKRVFKLPDGEYITSETIPSGIIEQIVLEAVQELESE
jgi:hypothetical protein